MMIVVVMRSINHIHSCLDIIASERASNLSDGNQLQ
jgi:hypothetical protein